MRNEPAVHVRREPIVLGDSDVHTDNHYGPDPTAPLPGRHEDQTPPRAPDPTGRGQPVARAEMVDDRTSRSAQLASAERSQGIEIVLYCRASVRVPGRRAEILNALHHLAQESRIRSFAVHEWPASIDLAPEGTVLPGAGQDFQTLEQWAADHGVTLQPAFYRRSLECAFTGLTVERVSLPMFLIVVTRDDQIEAVAPCRRDGRVVTIDDALESLAIGRPGLEIDQHQQDPTG